METIPPRFFRHDTVFRNAPAGGLWTGFMSKAGITDDQVNADTDHFSLVLVLRGRGEYRFCDGRTWRLEPGMVFCRIPGKRHSTILDPDSRWQECFLAFSGDALSFMRQQGLWRIPAPVFTTVITVDWLERLRTLTEDVRDAPPRQLPLCWTRAAGLAAELITLSGPPVPRGRKQALRQACRLLGERFTERLDMASLARECGMGYSLFRKEFKAFTGQSPGAYRIQRRIDRACHLLLATDKAVGAIAEELGYADPYTFSEQFRKVAGISPRPFRERHGKKA